MPGMTKMTNTAVSAVFYADNIQKHLLQSGDAMIGCQQELNAGGLGESLSL